MRNPRDHHLLNLQIYFVRSADELLELIRTNKCEDVAKYEELLCTLATSYRQISPGKSLFADTLASWRGENDKRSVDTSAHVVSEIKQEAKKITSKCDEIIGGVGRVEATTKAMATRFKGKNKKKYRSWSDQQLKCAAEIWVRYRFDTSSIKVEKGRKISKANVFFNMKNTLDKVDIKSKEDFAKALNNAQKRFPGLFPKKKRQSLKNLSRR